MFIKIASSGRITLEEVDNFRAFKVVTTSATTPSSYALIGRLDGDHVWVDRGWLEANGRPGDATWLAGLAKMLGYAKGAGWLDETGAVRAHIERSTDLNL